ncbi:MAG: response regulator [Magnetococcales bacterium]|nr:response regulator [Magnetococcales bacterium]
MTVRKKIFVAFFALFLLVALFGGVIIYLNHDVKEKIDEISTSNYIEIQSSSQASYQLQRIKSNIREILLEVWEIHELSTQFQGATEAELLQLRDDEKKFRGELAHAIRVVQNNLALLKANTQRWVKAIKVGLHSEEFSENEGGIGELEELEQVEKFQKIVVRLTFFSQQFLDLIDLDRLTIDADSDEIWAVHKKLNKNFELFIEPLSRLLQDIIQELVGEANKEMEAFLEQIRYHTQLATVTSFFLIVLVSIAAIIIGVILSLAISRPLGRLKQAAIAMGKGHFVPVEGIPSKGEIGQLALAFNTMLTNLKQSMEQLSQEKKRADDASMAKGEFLANMSHEIRTPMNAIIGLSDLACQSDLRPRERDYFSKISHASRSLLCILNDILDFSKIEAGKMELEEEEFLLREVFEHLADIFRTQAIEKRVELVFSLAKGCRLGLLGDRLRLEQVLMNLLGNALKFTEEGEVEVRVTTLVESAEEVTLEFLVHDTGIGMTTEQLQGLFHAFSQADATTTRKFGGTGLGLAISKQLTRLMGGEIEVESQFGVGSQFRFTAQFRRNVAFEEQDLILPEEMKGLRTLVVDDNQTARGSILEILSLFEFAARSVESLAGAQEAIQQGETDHAPFQLLLINHHCLADQPEALTLQEILAPCPPGERPKTLLLSTIEEEEALLRERERVGAEGSLVKPVNCSDLFDRIMELFGKAVTKAYRLDRDQIDLEAVVDRIGGGKVLLVEDHAINRQVAGEILAGVGLEVHMAEDGVEALRRVAEESYDVVLMDIQMPKMDGLEATRQIRRRSGLEELPIIAMTAHAIVGDREKSLEAGMNDHVTKPINRKALFSTLMQWMKPFDRTRVKRPELATPSPDAEEIYLPKQIPGIDLVAAMNRLGGNRRLLLSLLREFERDFAESGQKIRQALAVGQPDGRKRAQALIHSVKGMAGNLSALALFERAQALESSLEQTEADPRIAGLVDQFEEKMVEVVASIQSFQASVKQSQEEEIEAGGVAQVEMDLNKVSLTVELLSGYLHSMDTMALETFESLKKQLSGAEPGVQEQIERLEESVDCFDFNQAHQHLQAIARLLAVEPRGL